MKKTTHMIFYIPINSEQLKQANRKIAQMARKKEKVEIIWKNSLG